MRTTHCLTAKIAAAALVAAGSLITLQPSASAAVPAHAATVAHTQSTAAVTGTISIGLSAGGTITIPGASLSADATLDTGIQVSAVATMTNDTDASLVFSSAGSGGSTNITLTPGASANISTSANGTLTVRVA
ncbi:hypothetical protein [Streptomyces sp. NPDC086835]|uniref:hypothetical protein n=1 Tax=Streptomyces sp. NPDC086835 TaxID=3365761 RepID=UPI003810189A